MKKENRLMYFATIVLTAIAMIIFAPSAFAQSEEDIISTNQIVYTTHYYPQGVYGNYEYHTNSGTGILYSENRITKKKKTLVKNYGPGLPSVVTVYKKNIYYNGNEKKQWGVFRIGVNGKNKKLVIKNAIYCIVSNNKLFFEKNNSIYSANLDGSKQKKEVAGKGYLYIQGIASNRIYYSGTNKKGMSGFLCYDMKTKKTINLKKKFNAINVIGFDGDKVFFDSTDSKTNKYYAKYLNVKTGKIYTVCRLSNDARTLKYLGGKLFYQIIKTDDDYNYLSVSLKSYDPKTKKVKTYYTVKGKDKCYDKKSGILALFGKYLYGTNGYQAKVR